MRNQSVRFRGTCYALAGALLFAGANVMSAEQPEYDVIATDGDVEYRQYEPYLVAETVVVGPESYKKGGNEGFKRLFKYITGANSGGEKVSMGQIGNMKGNGCDCFTGVDGKKTCKSMGSDYCPPGACGGRCDGSPPGPQSGYLACKNGTTQCGGGCSVAGPTNMDGCNYETENCGGFCTCQPCSPN